MRRFLLLLVPLALLLGACQPTGGASPATPTASAPTGTEAAQASLASEKPTTTAPEATTATEAPAQPTETQASAAATLGLATETTLPASATPTPSATAQPATAVPGTSIQTGPQPNGRSVQQTVQEADLDGDGVPERVVSTHWQEADGGVEATLQVDIVAADGRLIYSQKSWEPLDDPTTGNPAELGLTIYDKIEAVDVRDLTGDGLAEALIRRRAAGTGQILTATIVSVTGGQASVLFERTFYKGALEFVEPGFQVTEPLYLYNEANCCPCRIDTLTFAWDGQRFAATSRTRALAEGAAQGECPAFPQAASWQPLETSGERPSPRRDAAMVLDLTRSRVILFGGRSGGTALDDTWALDLATRTWALLASGDAPRPPARFSMVAGIDQERNRLLIATGQAQGNQFFNDVWSFDLASDSWSQVGVEGEPPAPRYGASGGIAPFGGDALYLTHGFTDQGRFDDTWALDLAANAWQNVTPDGELPLKRCLAGAAVDAPGSLVLYGGCSSGFGPCPQGDTWHYDRGREEWTQLGTEGGPAARQFPGLVAMSDRAESLLFGGQGEGNVDFGDVWALDNVTGRWTEITPEGTAAPARNGHSMVWIEGFAGGQGQGYALVFGGESGDGELNDLWMLLPGDR